MMTTKISMTNNGTVSLSDGAGGNININSKGSLEITSNKGQIKVDNSGVSGSIDFSGKKLSIDSNGKISAYFPTSDTSGIQFDAHVDGSDIKLDSLKADSPDFGVDYKLLKYIPIASISGDFSLTYKAKSGWSFSDNHQIKIAGKKLDKLASDAYDMINKMPVANLANGNFSISRGKTEIC